VNAGKAFDERTIGQTYRTCFSSTVVERIEKRRRVSLNPLDLFKPSGVAQVIRRPPAS
jgi:hypothetical protein